MNDDLRPEYDLSQLLAHGVQGKYAERFRAESIVMPSSEGVSPGPPVRIMEFIDAVETYYERSGILSTSFTCEFKSACQRNGAVSGPKSAFVGSRYGSVGLPRLLFVSLDAGWAEMNNAKRTPSGVREDLEGKRVEQLPRHAHWYRTHELAWAILREFDDRLRLDDITPYFAHTNAAKCCTNSGNTASQVAYLNCHRYLAGEITALDPDIVVTQGKEAKFGADALVDKITKCIDKPAAEVLLCERRRFLLHTYHPRYARGFYGQRKDSDGWKTYAAKIRKFVEALPKAR